MVDMAHDKHDKYDKQAGTSTLSGLYDLPRIYDILHIPGTKEDVKSLFDIADRWVAQPATPRGRWLEPACGSGRLLISAAKRGVRGVGIDLNAAMLRFARKATGVREKKLLKFLQGDICHLDEMFKSERFDFAFIPINTIRHLRTDAQMIRHFNAVSELLKPGGVYVIGMSLSAYGIEADNEDRWEGKLGRTRVIQNVQYLPARGGKTRTGRMEQVISHLTIYEGKSVQHVDDCYQLRSYDLEQWVKLIEKSKLRLLEIVNESGTPIAPSEPGYSIFVLTRRDDARAKASRWHGQFGTIKPLKPITAR